MPRRKARGYAEGIYPGPCHFIRTGENCHSRAEYWKNTACGHYPEGQALGANEMSMGLGFHHAKLGWSDYQSNLDEV